LLIDGGATIAALRGRGRENCDSLITVSKRPPFLGYNHNVRHKGRLFHVQTEDSGLTRPVLTTHVFIEGTILATLRSQYTLDEPDAVVQKRMQTQHKTMLKRVRDGEFDTGEESAPEAPMPESAQATKPLAVPAAAEAAAARKPGSPAAPASAPPLSDRPTGEIVRPNLAAQRGESNQDTAPVQKSAEPSALAARLGIAQSGRPGVVPPPPIAPGARPGAPGASATSQESPAAIDDDDIEPVVELEVPPPSDDDEPLLTIEAAEPTEEEAEAAELSKATPLPAAVPLGHDETFIMGAADLIPPPRTGPFTVSIPMQPTGQTGRPFRGTRPVSARPLHSGPLRARATSEGVVVLCLGPARIGLRRRPTSLDDSTRITQPNLKPTTPAPMSSFAVMKSSDEPHFLDEKLMTFLRREAARQA